MKVGLDIFLFFLKTKVDRCTSKFASFDFNLGLITSETVSPPISSSRTEMKQTENLVTLSDQRETEPRQGLGQSMHSGVWDIVKNLNDERIRVDRDLRDEEQAEIRSLLNKQV